jgi:preprotein translocase subunit SecD
MTARRALLIALVTVVASWGVLGGVLAAGWAPKLGLDLQGGFSVILSAPEGIEPDLMDLAVDIMRDRIEGLGVAEPEIAVVGDRRIQVQLPGVTDRERALTAVGTTGQLSFRQVYEIGPAPGVSPLLAGLATTTTTTTVDGSTTTTDGTTTTTTIPVQIPAGVDPETGITIEDDPPRVADPACGACPRPTADGIVPPMDECPDVCQAWLQDPDSGLIYRVGPALVTGADVEDAFARYLPPSAQSLGGWSVDPSFRSEGAEDFEAATAYLSRFSVGDPMRSLAIVLDGEVMSAPPIASSVGFGESIPADSVIITVGGGDDQEEEAIDLANVLKYGALPTAFERERVEAVSATLGSDSLRAGLIAGIGGLILVAIVISLYYRALAMITIVGLSVFGSLLIAILGLLGAFQGTTLTLAGVTGIIVSIGITSDSYIVYFERIKEEARAGRPLRSSVEHGFARAFRTILTADTVSFAAAILLWWLAIGPVKGFAITLGIATLIDVAVAYFFTRPAALALVVSRFGDGGAASIRGAIGRPKEARA